MSKTFVSRTANEAGEDEDNTTILAQRAF